MRRDSLASLLMLRIALRHQTARLISTWMFGVDWRVVDWETNARIEAEMAQVLPPELEDLS